MPEVISVNISEKKGTVKHPVDEIELQVGLGIVGDAHAGDWHRQVSLLDEASIEKMRNKGVKDLTPGIFAENITTQGIELFSLPLGTRLTIGGVELEVTQIGKECHHHCQVYQQVGMCVMPTEGIFTRVITGGKIRPGDRITVLTGIRVAVITLSDKGFAGQRADLTGPTLVEALAGKARVTHTLLLPDDYDQLTQSLITLCDSGDVDVIFTTGGTGFAPRDITPEATLAVIDRQAPGIAEAMRAASMQITPRAMLSRAVAGIRKQTLIVNLPGSPKGAMECMAVFLPAMAHAVETLRGEAYECAPKPEEHPS